MPGIATATIRCTRALVVVALISLTSQRFCSAFLQKTPTTTTQRLPLSTNTLHLSTIAPDPKNSRFGRQDYWNELYEKQQNFSWYAGWDELAPFVEAFIGQDNAVLLPGVGNDATLIDMYIKGGYTNLTAMDYAPEAMERCREMFEEATTTETSNNVNLVVADARDLKDVFEDEQFDAVFEKGTLDAIFLSGGNDKDLALQNMKLAIAELGRCVKPAGIFLSISGVVMDAIQDSFDEQKDEWLCLVNKDDMYMTEEGFTSNNIDGTLLVWRKR